MADPALDSAAIEIQPGRIGDAAAINDIYNWYVLNSTATFDIEPWPSDRRQDWIALMLDRNNPYHVVTARSSEGIVGFACNGPFRPKAAYESSTEVTVYTDPGRAGSGTGAMLYKHLFKHISATPLHRAYAVISLPNDRSVNLHQEFAFEYVGTLNEVGFKFNRHIDVAWYQKKLDHCGQSA